MGVFGEGKQEVPDSVEWFKDLSLIISQAATTMQRLLPSGEPSQRNFWFWGIVANILASHDLEIDLKMRSLYSELAFKTLDKAANMTLSLSVRACLQR